MMQIMNFYKLFLLFSVILIFSDISFCQETLTLEDAVAIALKNNYSISIARNQSLIAENNSNIGNAGFLPSLDASGSYSKTNSDTRQEYVDGRVIDRNGAKSTNISGGLDLNWTIFDGLRMFSNLELLKQLNKIGKDNLKLEIENNMSDVIDNYFNLIREKQVLVVLNEAIVISEERVRIAESKKDVGSGSKFDLRQAQVDLNEDRSNLLKEELIYEQLKVSLNQLLGRDVNSDFTVTDTITIDKNLNLDELRNKTNDRNTTLAIAQKDLSISEINHNIARAELFPVVSLNGQYNYTNSESQAGFVQSNENYSLSYGVTASFNLFNGFNTRTKIENAEIEIENSRLNFDKVKTDIEAGLLNTYKKYLNSLQLVNLEEENLSVARESVDIALERLKLGNITPLEFRETQRKLIDAKSRLVSAQYDAKSAETELLKLSGELIQ
jgi:outer membrane protein TolC